MIRACYSPRVPALASMERYEEALDCFDAVLEAWHNNQDALLAKASILKNLGRHK